MQLDNIRVSRKLWGAFIGLMVAMLIMSGWAQNRANNSMVSAMDAVVEIEGRIGSALRWRGATETAVTMVMGGVISAVLNGLRTSRPRTNTSIGKNTYV